MKPTRVEEVLEHVLSTRWPAFVWGPPGVGKSSIIRKIAAKKKLDLLDIRASLLDPTDLRGIPTVDGDQARWCPPNFHFVVQSPHNGNYMVTYGELF